MVMLLFYVGEDRYACDCTPVVEVVPKVPLKIVAHAPPHLAGLIRYTGSLFPVLDFVQLRDGRPADDQMSTRIILVDNGKEANERQLMGMIVERLTETIPLEPKDFSQHNMSFRNLPYLSGVYGDDYGVIQLVETIHLFPVIQNIFSEVT